MQNQENENRLSDGRLTKSLVDDCLGLSAGHAAAWPWSGQDFILASTSPGRLSLEMKSQTFC